MVSIEAVTILAVGLPGVEALAVTIIDRALQHLRAVPVRFVVASASAIPVVVWPVVAIAPLLQAQLISTQSLEITLLVTQLVQTSLLLEQSLTLIEVVLPTLPILVIALGALLLFEPPIALTREVVVVTTAIPVTITIAIAVRLLATLLFLSLLFLFPAEHPVAVAVLLLLLTLLLPTLFAFTRLLDLLLSLLLRAILTFA